MCFHFMTNFVHLRYKLSSRHFSPDPSLKVDSCFLSSSNSCLGNAALHLRYKKKKKGIQITVRDSGVYASQASAASFLKATCVSVNFTAKRITIH